MNRFNKVPRSHLMQRVTAICFALALACLPLHVAQAATYTIPMDKSVAEINVPDSWNPNSSDLGVDAASPDNKLFFSIYATTNKDENVALQDSLSIFSDGQVLQIDMNSLEKQTVNIGSIPTQQYGYVTKMNGKPGYIAINLKKLSTGGYLQIIRWGNRKSLSKSYPGSQKIFKSLKLLGQ